MHELSIAQGIVSAVRTTAAAEHIERIARVRVAIGELAGVDIAALQFAWLSFNRTGLLARAELIIERPAGLAWCMQCATQVPLHRHGDACPHCGGYQLTAVQGHELQVLDFDVADEPLPDSLEES